MALVRCDNKVFDTIDGITEEVNNNTLRVLDLLHLMNNCNESVFNIISNYKENAERCLAKDKLTGIFNNDKYDMYIEKDEATNVYYVSKIVLKSEKVLVNIPSYILRVALDGKVVGELNQYRYIKFKSENTLCIRLKFLEEFEEEEIEDKTSLVGEFSFQNICVDTLDLSELKMNADCNIAIHECNIGRLRLPKGFSNLSDLVCDSTIKEINLEDINNEEVTELDRAFSGLIISRDFDLRQIKNASASELFLKAKITGDIYIGMYTSYKRMFSGAKIAGCIYMNNIDLSEFTAFELYDFMSFTQVDCIDLNGTVNSKYFYLSFAFSNIHTLRLSDASIILENNGATEGTVINNLIFEDALVDRIDSMWDGLYSIKELDEIYFINCNKKAIYRILVHIALVGKDIKKIYLSSKYFDEIYVKLENRIKSINLKTNILSRLGMLEE